MRLIIEGTEEEIKRCLEKLAGEKYYVEPSAPYPFPPIYPTYPTYPGFPYWGTPRQPWEPPFIVTYTC